METRFVELILSGTVELAHGFVVGYREGYGRRFSFFFHHHKSIRHDTVSEFIKELLEIENRVDLCVEQSVAKELIAAIKHVGDEIAIEIKGSRPIRDARFDFSFAVYDENVAPKLKAVFDAPPAGVQFEDFEPREQMDPEAAKERSMGYSPVHPYELKGSGTARGSVGGILDLYAELQKHQGEASVQIGDIELRYRDEEAEKHGR
jgi:hypothetical protein